MDVSVLHKIEFSSDTEPTIQELRNVLAAAEAQGFGPDTPVYIRGNHDDREHDYSLRIVIQSTGTPNAKDNIHRG